MTTIILALFFISSYFGNFALNFRFAGTFGEPSWYGLFLASVLLANITTSKIFTFTNTFLVALLFLTRSSHIVSFFISLILIYLYPSIRSQVSSIKRSPFSINLRLVFYTGLFCIIAVTIYPILPDHYTQRFSPLLYSLFNFSTYVDTSAFGVGSVSSVSYINGFLQAVSALFASPLIGLGSGMTGYFDQTFSVSSNYFASTLLNLSDAYSLLFRGLIEFGLIFLFLLFKWLARYLFLIYHSPPISKWYLSMGFCLFIGALVKQPILPSNLVFCSLYILILFNNPLLRKNAS